MDHQEAPEIQNHFNFFLLKLFCFLFQFPNSEQMWKEISKDFESRWNFPHCIGAMDGKISFPQETRALITTTIKESTAWFSLLLLMQITDFSLWISELTAVYPTVVYSKIHGFMKN
uniref:Uncharacterized protein n=1 Tax=Cacopsylla melanoneura TaxID=428564 RepID=A0A8D8TD33_9HEMI